MIVGGEWFTMDFFSCWFMLILGHISGTLQPVRIYISLVASNMRILIGWKTDELGDSAWHFGEISNYDGHNGR
jgi:hypothetical protein